MRRALPNSKKTPKVTPEPTTRTKEGFSGHTLPTIEQAYLHGTPMVGNYSVRVYRYRMTLERIEEPQEVIVARLVKLFRETDNHHDRNSLAEEGKRLGINLRTLVKASE